MTTIKTSAVTSPEQLDADKRDDLDAILVLLATERNQCSRVVHFDDETAAAAAAWLKEYHEVTIAPARILKYWNRHLKSKTQKERRARSDAQSALRHRVVKLNSPFFRELNCALAQLKDEAKFDAPDWLKPTYDEVIALLEMELEVITRPNTALKVFRSR